MGKLGKAAGKLGKVGKGAAVCGLHSFAAETPVATPEGQRAIGTLQAGDQVTVYDPDSGKSSTQTVEHVWINQDDDLLDVTLVASDATLVSADLPTKQRDAELAAHGSQAPPTAGASESSDLSTGVSETVHTTQRHLWLTSERGWVEARALLLGERVVRLDGSTATVAGVVVTPGVATRYDLTVSQLHTFAVGDGAYVVHNCDLPGLSQSQILKGLAEAKDVAIRAKARAGAVLKKAGDDNILFEGFSGQGLKGGSPGPFAPSKKWHRFQSAGKGNCAEFYCSLAAGKQEGTPLDLFVSHGKNRGPCRACASTLQKWTNANQAPIRVIWQKARGRVGMHVWEPM